MEQGVVLSTSEPLAWEGLRVEAGRKSAWEPTELALPYDYLCFNLAGRPLAFETRERGRFRRVVLGPGEAWTCAAADPFTHRVREECLYGVATFAPGRLAQLAAVERVELRRAYAVRDGRLEHLFRALLAEAERGGENGPVFAQTVGSAIAVLLAAEHGVSGAATAPSRGGIPPRRLRRVLELVDARLADRIRLEELAATAGLSPFHFAREFRRATGTSPHQHVVSRRLERARALLTTTDESVGRIAASLGFADQSHLARLFRRHFGASPREVRRRSR